MKKENNKIEQPVLVIEYIDNTLATKEIQKRKRRREIRRFLTINQNIKIKMETSR